MRNIELKELEGTWRCQLEDKHYDLTIRLNDKNTFFTEVDSKKGTIISEEQGVATIDNSGLNAIIRIGEKYAITIWMILSENQLIFQNDQIDKLEFRRLK